MDRYPIQLIDSAVDIAKCVHRNYRIHLLEEEFGKKDGHAELRENIKKEVQGKPGEAAVRDALDNCTDQQLYEVLLSSVTNQEKEASVPESTGRSI